MSALAAKNPFAPATTVVRNLELARFHNLVDAREYASLKHGLTNLAVSDRRVLSDDVHSMSKFPSTGTLKFDAFQFSKSIVYAKI